MKKALLLIMLAIPFLAFADDEVTGKELFRNNCKACHNIDKNLVGPALKDVHTRRDSAWIYDFIKGSTAMIEAGDTTAVALFQQFNQVPMPDQRVTDAEISKILDYIKAESVAKVDDNPIPRPAERFVRAEQQLRFSSYTFWIPFTIMVIILIVVLYYMTVLNDFSANQES